MIDLPTPALIGVIHLPPLPGSPAHQLPMSEIIDRAQADAETLDAAGFDAAIVENYGDVPFHLDHLAPSTIACMAVIADHIRRTGRLRVGVNALRNDAVAALGIAVAVGAVFIRVNIHTGVAATDQGLVSGRADRTLRCRKLLGARVAILADVHVKHAVPVGEADIARAAQDAAYRGLADGLIVTGPSTGQPVDPCELDRVRQAVPDRRLFIGSGATAKTIGELLTIAGGVIVGSGIKRDHDPAQPIDAAMADEFVRAARRR